MLWCVSRLGCMSELLVLFCGYIIMDKTGLECYMSIPGLQIIFIPVFMGMEFSCTTAPLTGNHFCDLSSSHTHKVHFTFSKKWSWNVDKIICPQLNTTSVLPMILLLILLIKRLVDCVISGFYHSIYEIFALLGCCLAYIGDSLPTFRDNLSVPPARVKKSSSFLGLLDLWRWDQ